MSKVYVVDDDAVRRAQICRLLTGEDIHPEPFDSIDELIRFMPSEGFILVHDEGEVPLLLCLEALFSGGRLEDVPSLIWTEGGELRSTHAMIHDLDIRPTYDLTDAHLEGYRARNLQLIEVLSQPAVYVDN